MEFHLRFWCDSDQTLDVTIANLQCLDKNNHYHITVWTRTETKSDSKKRHRQGSPATTVTFMYKPEIPINNNLMDMLNDHILSRPQDSAGRPQHCGEDA